MANTKLLQRALCTVLILVTLSQVIYLNLNIIVGWDTVEGERPSSSKGQWMPSFVTIEFRKNSKIDDDEAEQFGSLPAPVKSVRPGGEGDKPSRRQAMLTREHHTATTPSSNVSTPLDSPHKAEQNDSNIKKSLRTKANLPEPQSSREWRIQSCVDMGLWDLKAVVFMSKGQDLQPIEAIASGSASDPDKGNNKGFEPEGAVMGRGRMWGGRPGADGHIYIGAKFKDPVAVGCMSVYQADKYSDCISLMRRTEEGEWVRTSYLYDIMEGNKEVVICNPWVQHIKGGLKPTSGSMADLEEIAAGSNTTKVVLYSKFGCKGEKRVITEQHHRFCLGDHWPNGHPQAIGPGGTESMRVVGEGEIDLYSDCAGKNYAASLLPMDGCTDFHYSSWPSMGSFKIVEHSSLKTVQSPQVAWSEGDQIKRGSKEEANKKIRIVCSVESSEYHGYQVQASLYSFHDSRQSDHGAMWTRLMTSSEPDDISDVFPTFYAKRHPYSKRYSPLNKADVTAKWYASINAPALDEVIVMVDPDNWLLHPLEKYAAQVRPGQALAEGAFFQGQSALVRKLWLKFCRANCESAVLDMSAVPYFIHSSDLANLAPLWKEYCLLMRYQLDNDPAMAVTFHNLQITWCVEMYAYVFAAAELGIRHTINPHLQVRDVDGLPPKAVLDHLPMIHIGRAWFPKDYQPGAIWHHTEGAAWRNHGAQVWCKCNYTSGQIVPWPIPDGVQFVSYHTLRILHDAIEFFGKLPPSKYRISGHEYSKSWP